MHPFPVSSSILSGRHLGTWVRSRYDLTGDVQCRIIKAGINHTYKVTGEDQAFILRAYSHKWRSVTEISEEIRLLRLLKQHNIPVSYPIANTAGAYIQELDAPEGKRYAVLFSFAAGDKIIHNFSNEAHYELGILMARIHKITQDLSLERIDYTPETLITRSMKRLEEFLPAETEEMKFMKSAQSSLLEAFENFNKPGLRTGTVHMDLWFDNLNITPGNHITLFDFDFCGNGILCLDLAYFIMQLHAVDRDEISARNKMEHFLNGYESITAISPEEKRIIPMLGTAMYIFYLGIQCSRFDDWSNVFLNESYLKRYINVFVKRYWEIGKGLNL